ncbi:putative CCR4-associated factor 1-like protein 8 [Cucumis melo var. makuwa]|uniref:CCR4-associated factor 1-like protein 8 n=2 Tax=Cucumis melo TaxID=3656 RepID=A0A5A7TSL5_CUCMM|nr:putative CCR4-associated factor 1-like protein 8 [Cucumis melo var. makuwa]
MIAMDTEFPDFLRSTSRGAPEEHLYQDLKFNLNHLKILQLGLTLMDENEHVGLSWVFTFSDFDEQTDFSSPTSIQYLKNKKQRKDGIPSAEFRHAFLPIFFSNQITKWITFHGIHDVAYLLKLMMIRTMPDSMVEFAIIAQCHLGTVNDLKHIIRNCEHLMNGELGLKRLVELLNVNDTIFNGGSDSLLIALAYAKMKKTLKFSPKITDGFLYGFHYRIQGYRTFCYPITYYPNSLSFQNFQQSNNHRIILPKLIVFP